MNEPEEDDLDNLTWPPEGTPKTVLICIPEAEYARLTAENTEMRAALDRVRDYADDLAGNDDELRGVLERTIADKLFAKLGKFAEPPADKEPQVAEAFNEPRTGVVAVNVRTALVDEPQKPICDRGWES